VGVRWMENDKFRPLREGSNFEVPNFFENENPARFSLATGKSKKLYERAVSRALYEACSKPLGVRHTAVAYDGDVSIAADERLFQRCYA
jgi:hypothetical protein